MYRKGHHSKYRMARTSTREESPLNATTHSPRMQRRTHISLKRNSCQAVAQRGSLLRAFVTPADIFYMADA